MKTERTTCPLWECLSDETLNELIKLQWKLYGKRLDLLSDAFREIESLEEIDRLMCVPTKGKLGG